MEQQASIKLNGTRRAVAYWEGPMLITDIYEYDPALGREEVIASQVGRSCVDSQEFIKAFDVNQNSIQGRK